MVVLRVANWVALRAEKLVSHWAWTRAGAKGSQRADSSDLQWATRWAERRGGCWAAQ